MGWRHACVKLLAEKVGPVADLIVEDVLVELGVKEHDVTASHFVKLVRSIYEKLPATLDRRALCQDLHVAVLQAYGFTKKT
jgi:hypothetical protein